MEHMAYPWGRCGYEETLSIVPARCLRSVGMDQLGMTRKDLEALIGGRGRVSEVLLRKRRQTLLMIRRLHRAFADLAAIDFTAMFHPIHDDLFPLIINPVQNTKVSDANAIAILFIR